VLYSEMAALRNLKRINLRISCVVRNLCPFRYRSNTIAVLPYTDERSELALSFWTTPGHAHAKKKEDIICRWGKLAVQVWATKPPLPENTLFAIPINHEEETVTSGSIIELEAGSRVTLVPGVYHEFYPVSAECIIEEVSTANDDLHDNFFVDPRVGRYPGIEEDEPPTLRVISET
jgi:D-lyxose ketol-isomerase